MGIPQCLLRRPATVPLQAVVQGAGDNRGETLEPFLHHIVGGSSFDALDRAFLSERAGDEDEGDFEAALPQQAQCAQPIEARKIVIGEDQVELGSFQVRFEFLPGDHLLPDAIVAGGPKLPYFELCVEDAGTWPTIRQIREACAKSRKPGKSGLSGHAGGVEEDRTPDLRIANATLSQLSYNPTSR